MVAAGQGRGVDGIVFQHEQGVEQLVLTGDSVNLAECHMLVFQRVGVGRLHLIEQVGGGAGRCDTRPHRHGVDEEANHRFRTDQLGRPTRDCGAEHDVVLAGQPCQELCKTGLQRGVDGGVARAGQFA
ncbi:hypothetical protein MTY59_22280 [Mycobacterium senriense]|uniref:Uncharacterized protein n=1 Tax=Mycobacterium senriense TaxID=2775496 RepID=A0ABN6IH54_9MYCO|nr:hypothetical protein MTY59_22280 [Mycobacterium senriense]